MPKFFFRICSFELFWKKYCANAVIANRGGGYAVVTGKTKDKSLDDGDGLVAADTVFDGFSPGIFFSGGFSRGASTT